MKKFLYLAIAMMFLSIQKSEGEDMNDLIEFQVEIKDPTIEQRPVKKMPVWYPQVRINSHKLTFLTSCDGYILRIVDAEGEAVFATILNAEQINLPISLAGEFIIELSLGDVCYYGGITL